MLVAITGATGFIGRYIVDRLRSSGHGCRCWHRSASDLSGFEPSTDGLEWVPGGLADEESAHRLVKDCDAVVHAALDRPGTGFRGAEGNVADFVQTNVVGTIRLVEAARSAGVPRFVFVSTCAVHEQILDDRPLDETHPMWPLTHYGAHKAAIEKFVHSYGFGAGYDICAVRPSGVYGATKPVENSKWFPLIQSVVRGETVHCARGGKEVHAADVAQAVEVLLTANDIAGEVYSCCDQYISDITVAQLAREISGRDANIEGRTLTPKHQIVTAKLEALGVRFGGDALLRRTVEDLVRVA